MGAELPREVFEHSDWPDSCECPRQLDAFDVIAADELRRPVSLASLLQSNPRYMFVNSLDDYTAVARGQEGVYILWENVGYCEVHHHQVNEAIYIGKGLIDRRLATHAEKKKFNWDLIFITHIQLPNRMAKHIEQLLLDIYGPVLNKAEKRGTKRLYCCWDDGLLD